MKRFQSGIQEIKNYTKSTGSKSDQREERLFELEDRDAFQDQLLKDSPLNK